MAHYHPNNELLMQFAAGQLSNALGIMVACHIENCTECRHATHNFEHLGGEILESLDSIEVSPDFVTRTLAKLAESADTATKPSVKPTMVDSRLPKPLQRFLPNKLEQLPWHGFTKNIQQFDLPFGDNQYSARFYKIKAGKELPQHTHKGNEYTMVMDGAFSDEAGSYYTGDFILADTQTHHQPRAHANSDCICFAVQDAPLKFTGFWGRMLNPFITQ
jgi:putative transcriptional regulator